jgi:hypothetical protein
MQETSYVVTEADVRKRLGAGAFRCKSCGKLTLSNKQRFLAMGTGCLLMAVLMLGLCIFVVFTILLVPVFVVLSVPFFVAFLFAKNPPCEHCGATV